MGARFYPFSPGRRGQERADHNAQPQNMCLFHRPISHAEIIVIPQNPSPGHAPGRDFPEARPSFHDPAPFHIAANPDNSSAAIHAQPSARACLTPQIKV